MRDVMHNMLDLHVAQQLRITLGLWTSELSPTSDKDADLNWHFSFSIDLKQNIGRLTQVKNEEREVWCKIFTIYKSKRSKGTVLQ